MKTAWVGMMSAFLAAPLAAEVYTIDAGHSEVGFRVRHMMVSKVAGRFDAFSGTVEYEEGKPKAWKVSASIDAASINTNHADRDKHLRAEDFFDAEKHPKISFKSSKVSGVKGDKAKLHGELTIRGTTKPVVMDLELGGVVKDPWGNQRLGATARTKINRKDFGVSWNKAMDSGGLVLGEEVEITLEIEAIAKKG